MSLKGKGYCHSCRKVSYPSREVAARRAERMSSTKEPYVCPVESGRWHFGESYTANRHQEASRG